MIAIPRRHLVLADLDGAHLVDHREEGDGLHDPEPPSHSVFRQVRICASQIRQAALDEPREQGALGAELKVLLALAELPKATSKDREALREGYGRLTEGIETRIARRTRELLSIEAA